MSLFGAACLKHDTFYIKSPENHFEQLQNQININTATINELVKLDGIGEKLAARIIDYRTKYGNFRQPEHLLLVRGISENRFRKIQNLVKVE